MNDIEILEEILNRQIEDTEGTKIMKQAIENLIARNKELEEENWIMRTVDKQYINKDKIKEILEKYSPNHTNTFIENQEKYIKLITELQELLKQ